MENIVQSFGRTARIFVMFWLTLTLGYFVNIYFFSLIPSVPETACIKKPQGKWKPEITCSYCEFIVVSFHRKKPWGIKMF